LSFIEIILQSRDFARIAIAGPYGSDNLAAPDSARSDSNRHRRCAAKRHHFGTSNQSSFTILPQY